MSDSDKNSDRKKHEMVIKAKVMNFILAVAIAYIILTVVYALSGFGRKEVGEMGNEVQEVQKVSVGNREVTVSFYEKGVVVDGLLGAAAEPKSELHEVPEEGEMVDCHEEREAGKICFAVTMDGVTNCEKDSDGAWHCVTTIVGVTKKEE